MSGKHSQETIADNGGLRRIVGQVGDDLNKAMVVAAIVHDGQRDKGGEHYLLHPLHVMAKLRTLSEKIVALLHDAVEDSDLTVDDLRGLGFDDEICEAVEAITKKEGEDYGSYVGRVKANAIARSVKLADLEHNMDLLRLPRLTEADFSRLGKYKKTHAELSVG